MDENELTALLSSKTIEARRTWRCPDANQLAAYVQKELGTEKRRRLELHLADCTACLQTIAFLATEDDSNLLVPPQIVASARALVSNRPSRVWDWRWAIATATACLLVTVTFIIYKSRVQPTSKPVDLVAENTEPVRPGVTPTGTSKVENKSVTAKPIESRAPTVRGSRNNLQPILTLSHDGSVIRGKLQSMRWNAVPDASFYEIKVVTDDGGPVLTQTTNNTQLEIKTDSLAPGKYFVTVVAHLAGDRSVRSEPVSFRVIAPN
ncbi:MAG: hypothetical protein C5B55_02915 [Blastocatellia bacterium]|nr:MAG: hypothetical protein C5B55_02915 [Blastocatellia bacterium]